LVESLNGDIKVDYTIEQKENKDWIENYQNSIKANRSWEI